MATVAPLGIARHPVAREAELVVDHAPREPFRLVQGELLVVVGHEVIEVLSLRR